MARRKQAYLVIDVPKRRDQPVSGGVYFAGRTDLAAVLRGCEAPLTWDLTKGWQNFEGIAGTDYNATFQSEDILRFNKQTKVQLDYWVSEDILRPSVVPAGRSGRRLEWSYIDAFVAALLASLARHGVPLKTLKKISTQLAAAQKRRPKGKRRKEKDLLAALV